MKYLVLAFENKDKFIGFYIVGKKSLLPRSNEERESVTYRHIEVTDEQVEEFIKSLEETK